MPVDTPVTKPVADPTTATAVLPLTHVPPAALLVSVVLTPVHKLSAPEVMPGAGFTDTTDVAVLLQAPAVAVAV